MAPIPAARKVPGKVLGGWGRRAGDGLQQPARATARLAGRTAAAGAGPAWPSDAAAGLGRPSGGGLHHRYTTYPALTCVSRSRAARPDHVANCLLIQQAVCS